MPRREVVTFVGGPTDGVVMKRPCPLADTITCYVFRSVSPASGAPGQTVQVDTVVYRLEKTATGQYVYVCQATR